MNSHELKSLGRVPVELAVSRRRVLQLTGLGVAALGATAVLDIPAEADLAEPWDKTFPRSTKVDHRKVAFKNRYGITLAADLYLPKGHEDQKLPALAIGGPFGAVKEQSSGLYAQTMAEHGYVTVAFDPSYTGESRGEPRNVPSPDINTEDFSAAVDFLGLEPSVDRERIGIIGAEPKELMIINDANHVDLYDRLDKIPFDRMTEFFARNLKHERT